MRLFTLKSGEAVEGDRKKRGVTWHKSKFRMARVNEGISAMGVFCLQDQNKAVININYFSVKKRFFWLVEGSLKKEIQISIRCQTISQLQKTHKLTRLTVVVKVVVL